MGQRTGILLPPEEREPLRVMFVLRSLDIGGAERITVDLLNGIDRNSFKPELCCLKELGPLGEMLNDDVKTHCELKSHSFDVSILPRLSSLMSRREIDAVVTVGAGGDKMFWGRLAAYVADVPVVCSALHPSGSSDHVEWPNRLLASITDAFIAVARSHAEYLHRHEGCPQDKIRVIPNGINTLRFFPGRRDLHLPIELGMDENRPTVGIVAGLTPDKNHEFFLQAAIRVIRKHPEVQFLIVGDGPEREYIKQRLLELRIADRIHLVGTRHDVPNLLSLLDVFLFTASTESNPLVILESLACGVPVVSTNVGSVHEYVIDGCTGYLADVNNPDEAAEAVLRILNDESHAQALGSAGRELVEREWSLPVTIRGYEEMLREIYRSKCSQPERVEPKPSVDELLNVGL